jgi:hypothetical protein
MVGFYDGFDEPSSSILHDQLNLTDEGTFDSIKLVQSVVMFDYSV